jgi:5-hydroxyisourate hydrolase-like protein (transthyretin family)
MPRVLTSVMKGPSSLALLLFGALAASAQTFQLPDRTSGVIDGKAHILFWPSVHPPPQPGEALTLLSPDGCQVHLIPSADTESELVEPCGRWLLPASGKYRFWLEKDDLISPWPGVVSYDSANVDGKGMAAAAGVVPGGRVALAAAVALPESAGLRLLHIPPRTAKRPEKAFDRRLSRSKARIGALFPAGSALAGVFDRAGDAIALSRPVEIALGKTVFAAPRAPAAGSDVLLVLDRPRLRSSWAADEVGLTLGSRKPDVFVSAIDRVFAVWYGVTGKSASLTLTSPTLRFDPRELTLRPGKVVTVRDKLALLPKAKVSIVAPPNALDRESLWLEVRHDGERSAIERIAVKPSETYVIENLPAARLEAVLQIGAWDVPLALDLRERDEESLTFDLHPMRVTGTVYLGHDRAANAQIAFEGDREPVVVHADERGRYEVVMWEPRGDYIAGVTVPGRNAVPFIEAFLTIDGDRALDFHVPQNSYTVRITNAKTGAPVEGASVTSLNVWGDGSRMSQSVTTDASGEAALQPLREGRLSIVAKAKGYFEARPPERSVATTEAVERISVTLDPIEDAIRARVLHGDGRPASAADVWLVTTAESYAPPLWQGRTDGDGAVELPRRLANAIVLLRHPYAASAIRRLDGQTPDVAWTLAAESPQLTLRLDPSPRGRRGVRIAMWIDAVRVSGPALSFLTWGYEATDAAGLWSGRNLPPVPLRVLLWEQSAASEIAAGGRDHEAISISYPWSVPVTLRAID